MHDHVEHGEAVNRASSLGYLAAVIPLDRIFVLERGRIVESGTHAALLENTGLYYAMWRQQIGERRIGAPAVDVTV